MRAKVIIPLVGLASFILLLAISGRFGSLILTQPSPVHEAVAESPPATASIPVQPLSRRVAVEARAPAQRSAQPEIEPAALEEQREEASRQRVAELQHMASTRDGGSINTILSELFNQDAKIRRAALAAAVEIGDRNSIPALEEAMERNADPQEKVSIQQAIAFLQLPTLTEATASSGSEAAMQSSVSSGN
jgi:hypothetical protein